MNRTASPEDRRGSRRWRVVAVVLLLISAGCLAAGLRGRQDPLAGPALQLAPPTGRQRRMPVAPHRHCPRWCHRRPVRRRSCCGSRPLVWRYRCPRSGSTPTGPSRYPPISTSRGGFGWGRLLARLVRRSSWATWIPTKGRRCSTGCGRCGLVTGSRWGWPTVWSPISWSERWRCTPGTLPGPAGVWIAWLQRPATGHLRWEIRHPHAQLPVQRRRLHLPRRHHPEAPARPAGQNQNLIFLRKQSGRGRAACRRPAGRRVVTARGVRSVTPLWAVDLGGKQRKATASRSGAAMANVGPKREGDRHVRGLSASRPSLHHYPPRSGRARRTGTGQRASRARPGRPRRQRRRTRVAPPRKR